MEHALNAALRRHTAGRPSALAGRRADLQYRPTWRPARPDQLDRLIAPATR